jgi:predicted 3-demethylubiquinone-9 3-methyltransferase (glyoxalase superfamily)
VDCATQEEVDRLWDKLTEGGEEVQCGWLKDKYGLSWQIVPSGLNDLLNGRDAAGSSRAMQAMLQMKKIDLEKMRQAYEQEQ